MTRPRWRQLRWALRRRCSCPVSFPGFAGPAGRRHPRRVRTGPVHPGLTIRPVHPGKIQQACHHSGRLPVGAGQPLIQGSNWIDNDLRTRCMSCSIMSASCHAGFIEELFHRPRQGPLGQNQRRNECAPGQVGWSRPGVTPATGQLLQAATRSSSRRTCRTWSSVASSSPRPRARPRLRADDHRDTDARSARRHPSHGRHTGEGAWSLR